MLFIIIVPASASEPSPAAEGDEWAAVLVTELGSCPASSAR